MSPEHQLDAGLQVFRRRNGAPGQPQEEILILLSEQITVQPQVSLRR